MKRALLLLVLSCACAPTLPAPYVHARAAAEAAYGKQQFEIAGQRWLEAAGAARNSRDRAEARYRAATSFERAGNVARTRELYTLLARGTSERAARATFALALRRYFAELAERGGDRAVLGYLDRAIPELGGTDLAEQLYYERARRLEASEQLAPAADAYLAVAERFPYPYGAYWDDALLRGADCAVRLGRPEQAIVLLERMLRARESSHLSGSYERPLFADAAYRLAELYRDSRHDAAAARRAFRAVFDGYPTSTLRDDALWQEALIARQSEPRAACAPLSLLVAQFPDSRYAPCATKICVSLPKTSRECRAYVARQLEEEAPSPRSE
jgi:outer membrane protein assembly factor BamD (BamD/ComL family)